MAHTPPSFLIREAALRDRRELLLLARQLDSINLPTEMAELTDVLRRSTQSFRGRVRDRSHTVYLFCAERIATGKLVGASMIIGKHGTPESPHFYLEMDDEERYSKTLRRMFRHSFLRLRYSMDGPTEVGGLIVSPRMRRHPERIGKQLSWVRFLYLAKHRRRFEHRVLAEMLPAIGPGHRNLFWDHYGRPVTGLSFREADQLSTRDKEFIRALFPDSPLYTFLLPEKVRDVLGRVGETTRGAVRLLEQAGMRFLEHIDPFDGGPYYGAEVEQLTPVQAYRSTTIAVGSLDFAEHPRWMIGREDARGFRAVATSAMFDAHHIIVTKEALDALGVGENDTVDAVPLP